MNSNRKSSRSTLQRRLLAVGLVAGASVMGTAGVAAATPMSETLGKPQTKPTTVRDTTGRDTTGRDTTDRDTTVDAGLRSPVVAPVRAVSPAALPVSWVGETTTRGTTFVTVML